MDFKTYMLTEEKTMHVFCDMDGVLTDWEESFLSTVGKRVEEIPKKETYRIVDKFPVEWWTNLPWMPDGKELWKYLLNNFNNNNLRILSSPTKDRERKCITGKWEWLRNNGIVSALGEKNIILTSDKYKHVQDNGISILIDDTPKKINSWVNAGGIGILHKNAKDTITELNKYNY